MKTGTITIAIFVLLVSSIIYREYHESKAVEPIEYKFTPKIRLDIKYDSEMVSWDILNNTLDTLEVTINGELHILRWGKGWGRSEHHIAKEDHNPNYMWVYLIHYYSVSASNDTTHTFTRKMIDRRHTIKWIENDAWYFSAKNKSIFVKLDSEKMGYQKIIEQIVYDKKNIDKKMPSWTCGTIINGKVVRCGSCGW